MINLIKKFLIYDKNLIYIIFIFIIILSLSIFTLESSESEFILNLIWVCVTFVLQISTSNLFTHDYHEGVLEQIFIQPLSSKFIITCKIFSHWLSHGCSISAISSIFTFVVLSKNIEYVIALGLSLLFSTLLIISISVVGNALIIGKNSTVSDGISQILVLPIIMPICICFKSLVGLEDLYLNVHKLFVTAFIFAVVIVNSIIATYMALKFAVEQD